MLFPDSWDSYYIINWFDDEKECLQICFYGESEISRYDEIFDRYGIPLFYICTQTYLNNNKGVASVEKLGKAKNTTLFKFSQTDYPLDTLNPINYTGNDKKELKKIKNDYNKMAQMLNEINQIINSFKGL